MHNLTPDRVRTIEVTPARVVVRIQKVERVACRCLNSTVKRATPTGIVKAGSYASPSLLAYVSINKGLDGVPVNRLRGIMARSGVEFKSSTIEGYFQCACEELEPIAKAIRRECVNADYLCVDDTRMQILRNQTKQAPKNGRCWVAMAHCDTEEHLKQCFVEPTLDWKQSSLAQVIAPFAGDLLQGDGYAGYPVYVADHEHMTQAGCLDHARRKFFDAARRGCRVSREVLGLMGQLYAIEKELKRRGATHDERATVRLKKSVPVFDTIMRLVERTLTSPKSLTETAITYLTRQKDPLRAFLFDGRLEISNIAVEQLIRRIALVRNNSLFFGSVAGAKRNCHMLTVLLSSRRAGICPWAYLTDVLTKLADRWPNRLVGELVPHRWARIHGQQTSKKFVQQPLTAAGVSPVTFGAGSWMKFAHLNGKLATDSIIC